jgi:hypothetical protein
MDACESQDWLTSQPVSFLSCIKHDCPQKAFGTLSNSGLNHVLSAFGRPVPESTVLGTLALCRLGHSY